MSPLDRLAFHFDELNRLRILEPDAASQTSELAEETNHFLSCIESFKSVSEGFIRVIDSLSQEVDKEKIKAIGARNLVKSMAKQRAAQEQQLQALLLEKSTELERLRIQHQSLVKTETEQTELLDKLLLSY